MIENNIKIKNFTKKDLRDREKFRNSQMPLNLLTKN